MFKIHAFMETKEKMVMVNELLIFVLSNTIGVPGHSFKYKVRVKEFKPKGVKKLVRVLNDTCNELSGYELNLFNADNLMPKNKDQFKILFGTFSILLDSFKQTLPDSNIISLYLGVLICKTERISYLVENDFSLRGEIEEIIQEDWDEFFEILTEIQKHLTVYPESITFNTMKRHNAMKRLTTYIAGLFKTN